MPGCVTIWAPPPMAPPPMALGQPFLGERPTRNVGCGRGPSRAWGTARVVGVGRARSRRETPAPLVSLRASSRRRWADGRDARASSVSSPLPETASIRSPSSGRRFFLENTRVCGDSRDGEEVCTSARRLHRTARARPELERHELLRTPDLALRRGVSPLRRLVRPASPVQERRERGACARSAAHRPTSVASVVRGPAADPPLPRPPAAGRRAIREVPRQRGGGAQGGGDDRRRLFRLPRHGQVDARGTARDFFSPRRPGARARPQT